MHRGKRPYRTPKSQIDEVKIPKTYPVRVILIPSPINREEQAICTKVDQYSLVTNDPISEGEKMFNAELLPQDLLSKQFPPITAAKLAALQVKAASLESGATQLAIQNDESASSASATSTITRKSGKTQSISTDLLDSLSKTKVKMISTENDNEKEDEEEDDDDERKKEKKPEDEDEDDAQNEEDDEESLDDEGDYQIFQYADGGMEIGDEFGDDVDDGDDGDDDGPIY